MILDALAEEVEGQWTDEARLRRLSDPRPLPVSWQPAPEGLVADWPSLEKAARTGVGAVPIEEPDWAYGPEALAGTGPDLVEVVARRVPTGRLIVLGRPGAGKTMLLVMLVLGLLGDRAAIGGRVPILLSLASWDPETTSLREWLCGAVITNHPWLRQRDRTGGKPRRKVDMLLDNHLLYPVLDGLDEMAEPVRSRAVDEINVWLGASVRCRLTLTCRLDEFMETSEEKKAPAHRLSGTAGVVLDELEPDDVADYLRHDTGHADGAVHWRAVIEELGSGSAVDQALRTPLMVTLARVAFSGMTDPSELTELEDREAVQRHLFEQFVDAAYRDSVDARLRCPWSPAQAKEWLTAIARRLGDPPENTSGGEPLPDRVDLCWWRFHGWVGPWSLGVTTAALPALAVGVATVAGPALGARHPLGIGLGAGLLVGVLSVLVLGQLGMPRRTGDGTIARIAVAALAAVAGAVIGTLLHDPSGRGPTAGLIGAIGVGLGVGPLGGFRSVTIAGLLGGLAVGLTASVGAGPTAAVIEGVGAGVAVGAIVVVAGRSLPAPGLRTSRWSWGPGLAAAGLGAVTGYFTTDGDIVTTALAALAGFCLGLLNPDTGAVTAVGPTVALRRDRGTFIVFASLSGAAICAGASLAVHPTVGVAGGFTVGLVFASLQSAWLRYAVARVLLALRGELPWRLMAFLRDAHEQRGVLRQNGAAYQFRHVELQKWLARDTSRS